jgi:8-oxo-dGTP diphosphatase
MEAVSRVRRDRDRHPHGMSAKDVAAWRAKWGEGPFVTVDLVVFTLRRSARADTGWSLSMLLVERGKPPFQGRFAIPGGFLEEGETLEHAARRELGEETGISDLGDAVVEQLATFGDPDRDPRARIVSVVHTALVPWDRVRHARGGDDAADARFFDIIDDAAVDENGKPIALACDHEAIVRVAVERLRGRVTYTTAPFALMPEVFTLTELQHAYESILGVRLHRRAFRERVERERWVIPTGEVRSGAAHRPARLFRAATRALLWMRPWPEAAKVPGALSTRGTRGSGGTRTIRGAARRTRPTRSPSSAG